jgi:hypothetical protein
MLRFQYASRYENNQTQIIFRHSHGGDEEKEIWN